MLRVKDSKNIIDEILGADGDADSGMVGIAIIVVLVVFAICLAF